MTLEEIKNTPSDGRSSTGWLKEIAYQLALLNERSESKIIQVGKRK